MKEDVVRLKDYEGTDIEKSFVKQHVRRNKDGKIVQVRAHTDSRSKNIKDGAKDVDAGKKRMKEERKKKKEDKYDDMKPTKGESVIVDWDEKSQSYGVFGSDSGFAYKLFDDEESAKQYVKERFGEDKNDGTGFNEQQKPRKLWT